MVFKFIKQISAPSVFAKGMFCYKRQQYANARELIFKAGSWMPPMAEGQLYKALLLLLDHHLGAPVEREAFEDALDHLKASSDPDSADRQTVIADIEQILDAHEA